jgi:thioredoxin 1
MKKILAIITVVVLAICFLGYSKSKNEIKADNGGKGIEFSKKNWTGILAEAKQSKKLIFLDIYATWCGPCKKLKRTTFASNKVAPYFNSNFINVTLDGEQGEGLELAEKFRVSAYPSLYFVNGNGQLVASTVGYLTTKELMDFAKFAEKRAGK